MSSSVSAFDATKLQRSYEFLDGLPESLYDGVVSSTSGTLMERVAGVLSWRAALLTGRLPDAWTGWPAPSLRDALLRELAILDIARFCRDQPELVDELLLDMLGTADACAHAMPQRQREVFEELRRLEEERRQPPDRDVATREATDAPPSKPEVLPADIIQALRSEAARRAEEDGAAESMSALHDRWVERARAWSEIWDVFGNLGALLGRGRDLAHSILRHHGWQDISRLRKLLERCPQLTELVRTLGRLQERMDEGAPSVMERVVAPIGRARTDWRDVQTELAPHEVHGLTLSDDISRMIPAEAAILGHPVLRYLWHARRIEQGLLTYRVQGVMAERVSHDNDVMTDVEVPRPPRKAERGPILVCIDTSGSMHGAPETVAKAIVLEAVRVAHAETRACYLYAFSGPGDVSEFKLQLTEDGVAAVLNFLSCSFHGGTDVAEPLRRAITKLHEGAWQRADLLLVSDGEFPIRDDIVTLIQDARDDLRLRIHGLLVGSAQSFSMEAVSDHLHRFSDWRLNWL